MFLFEHYNFKKAKNQLELLKYLYKSVSSKYPILDDSDNEEKKLVYNSLLALSKKLEAKINDYEKDLISYEEFKEICEKYQYEYEKLTYKYPVIDVFASIARTENRRCAVKHP